MLHISGIGRADIISCFDVKGKLIGTWTADATSSNPTGLMLPIDGLRTGGLYLLEFKKSTGVTFTMSFVLQ